MKKAFISIGILSCIVSLLMVSEVQADMDCSTVSANPALKMSCGFLHLTGVLAECTDKTNTVCSSNEFNNCPTNVCLFKVGAQGCKAQGFDEACEGGSICDVASDTCVIDIGSFEALGGTTLDLRDNLRRIINVALGFLGIAIVVMIIYGGVLWLTAAGDEGKVEKGRHTLMWAAIGAIIISIAWTISSYVLLLGRKVG